MKNLKWLLLLAVVILASCAKDADFENILKEEKGEKVKIGSVVEVETVEKKEKQDIDTSGTWPPLKDNVELHDDGHQNAWAVQYNIKFNKGTGFVVLNRIVIEDVSMRPKGKKVYHLGTEATAGSYIDAMHYSKNVQYTLMIHDAGGAFLSEEVVDLNNKGFFSIFRMAEDVVRAYFLSRDNPVSQEDVSDAAARQKGRRYGVPLEY